MMRDDEADGLYDTGHPLAGRPIYRSTDWKERVAADHFNPPAPGIYRCVVGSVTRMYEFLAWDGRQWLQADMESPAHGVVQWDLVAFKDAP
jgi:hypothetical protein